MALGKGIEGYPTVRYASGLDLLRQMPGFVNMTRSKGRDGEFCVAYRYLEILCDGRTLYMETIDRTMQYLERMLCSESWRMLRPSPPLYVAHSHLRDTVRLHMLGFFPKGLVAALSR